MSTNHHPDDLIRLFNHCFTQEYRTKLAYGQGEPLYVPAREPRSPHMIYFAHGFFSSALHECAHWLIAGKARRALEDYGYWYTPEGRTPEQQVLFQQVEIKPQALEWILSDACGYRFQLSFDNLESTIDAKTAFAEAVALQKSRYEQQGLPARAQRFYRVLLGHYQVFEPA